MRIDLPYSRYVIACAALLACLLAVGTPAAAQDLGLPEDPLANPDRWLTKDRWSELRYGLSIREPHGALRIADTAQGDVMRWAVEGGTRVSLSFVHGLYQGIDEQLRFVKMPARVDVLKKQLASELELIVAGQVINTRADQVVEIGELVGAVNYYIVKPAAKDAKPMLYGLGLLQLDSLSVAVIKLEARPENIIQAISTYECMINSIQVDSVQEVNKRINGWIENSEALLEKLSQDDRVAAMNKDRLYRVLDNGVDLGYIRMWQRYQDKAYYTQLKQRLKAKTGSDKLDGIDRFELQGNALFVQSYFKGSGGELNQLFEAIDAVGKPNAYWQIKNSLRYKNDPDNLRAGTWVETGVRGVATIGGQSMNHIQITREGTPPKHMVDYLLAREKDPARRLRYPSADPRSYPSGDLVEMAWPTPKRAFLSSVDAALMPAMLPNEEQTYAFGAYHPESSKIAIRVMRVQPGPGDGKTVYLRPVLGQSPQVLVFDRNNDLVSQTYPDGRELRRTTREELARVWGVKLRD